MPKALSLSNSIYLPYASSGTTPETIKMAMIIITAGWQRRQNAVIHPLLTQAAYKRAKDMADKNYFSHTSPSGVTPNEVIRSVGYQLPSWYPEKGNNVESISIGADDAEEAVAGLFSSPKHHNHITGEDKFYADQRAIGVGEAIAKDGRKIFVFLSAPWSGG